VFSSFRATTDVNKEVITFVLKLLDNGLKAFLLSYLLLLPLGMNVFNPLGDNLGVLPYDFVSLGDDFSELLLFLLIKLDQLFMLLPQSLLFLALVTLPPIPLFLALLDPVLYYFFEFFGMISFEFLDFNCPFLQFDDALFLLVLRLKQPHSLLMMAVSFSLGTLLGFVVQLGQQKERVH
jgi:hypothetical protein